MNYLPKTTGIIYNDESKKILKNLKYQTNDSFPIVKFKSNNITLRNSKRNKEGHHTVRNLAYLNS